MIILPEMQQTSGKKKASSIDTYITIVIKQRDREKRRLHRPKTI
jgi:hypothetical protein